MHDFPPVVPEFPQRFRSATETGSERVIDAPDADQPDTRSPTRYLLWMVRRQGNVLVAAALVGIIWFLPGAVGPFLVGRAVDEGIIGGSEPRLVLWAALLLLLFIVGAGFGILMHTLAVRSWLIALYRTTKLVTRKTTQMGHVMPQRAPTGEILSVSSGDSDQFGSLMECLSRAAAALMAYLLVAMIVLSTSVKLGLLVLIAAPVLVGIAMPLLRPLQRRQATERTRSADLTSMATDIVAGLRILRGIGGEQTFGRNYADQSQKVRQAGVSAGTWQSLVDAVGVLFSGLFLVGLTWLGAREVMAGAMSVGQLISFFGYALFMVWPIQTFFELAEKWVRCLVSAHKTIAVLEQQPPWHEDQEPRRLPADAPLHEEATGFTAEPGLLTIVVSGLPDESAAMADRLGRYLPTDTDPVSAELDEGVKGRAAREARAQRQQARARRAARDLEIAQGQWGVRLGDVDLSEATMADVREHIMVTDTSSLVFAGTLQTALDPHQRLSRAEAERALHVAAAEDVFEGLSGGWQGVIDERGRGLSGGQRQRLVLARAIAADPEILILVEPTSAVDAHTEALIAERLSAERRGRTTVIMSVSPLLLHVADRVAFLEEGRVTDHGTHQELLHRNQDYRLVVARTMEDVDV